MWKDLFESLLEGLSLSKTSGKAYATAILDLLMVECGFINRGWVDIVNVIAFFVLALGYPRDLGDFSSGANVPGKLCI